LAEDGTHVDGFAIELGMTSDDPTLGIKTIKIRSEGFQVWAPNTSTARKVETAKPSKYSDGNLYLIVSETGARQWVLQFTWRGRAKEMGLGSAASVPLADAREKAASARRKIAQGVNPIEARKRDGGIPTFGEMADDVRETLSAGFRNEKHKAQWKSTLETYAAPLRGKPIAPSPPMTCWPS
jgi:Arm DNA-binding domain